MLNTNEALLILAKRATILRARPEDLALLLLRQAVSLWHAEVDIEETRDGECTVHEEHAYWLHWARQQRWCHEVLDEHHNVLSDHDESKAYVSADFSCIQGSHRAKRGLEQESHEANKNE